MMFEKIIEASLKRQGYTTMQELDGWLLLCVENPELIRRIKDVLRTWEKDRWVFMEPKP
jgi:hypothetical protein